MEQAEIVAALQHMLGSKGWTDVVRPALEKMNNNCHMQTRYGSKNGHSLEILQGYGRALDWMLSWDKKTERLAAEMMEALQEKSAMLEDEGGVGTIYHESQSG